MATVRYEKRDRIAWITLDRPAARNAIDAAMNAELAAVWADFAAADDVDVGILGGNGPVFCAGADLKTYIPRWAEANAADLRAYAGGPGLGGGLTRNGPRLHKPLVAAIDGPAFGGGFELALACDLRIATTNARFGVFEVRRGLHQTDGGLTRLLAIAGLGVALDLTLTGREVGAEEAFRLGLVSRLVAPEALAETVETTARGILANSQRALRSAKETLHALVGRSLTDALNLEALNGYSCPGDYAEVQERLARFFAKEA